MTISVKHAFASAKGDGSDPTQVQPSHWNAEHILSLAADRLIGRDSSGAGAAQEILCTAFARSLLGASDLSAFLTAIGAGAFTTGDVKLTLKITADPGWIMADDSTFGDTGSGATHTGPEYQQLFGLLWGVVSSDTYAPVYTSGGVLTTRSGNTAEAGWNAKYRMSLTKMLGRALAIAGSGSGLSARSMGQTVGSETAGLTVNQLPTFTPSGIISGVSVPILSLGTSGLPAGSFQFYSASNGSAVNLGGGSASFTGNPIGGGQEHANMQPTSFLNAMIKL